MGSGGLHSRLTRWLRPEFVRFHPTSGFLADDHNDHPTAAVSVVLDRG